MVREQLERDPPPPLSALYGRAVRLDPEIRNLDLRQFNAKYPLQVRRRKKRSEGGGGDDSPPSAGGAAAETASGTGETPSDGGRGRTAQREEEEAHAGRAGPGPESRAEAQALRSRVREILVQYAKAIVGAETRAERLEAVLQADAHADTLAHLVSPP